jgi:hypothetical protein
MKKFSVLALFALCTLLFAAPAALAQGLSSSGGNVQITQGGNVVTVRSLTNAKSLDVSIVDANGDQITSFGGGTQYAEDTVAADAEQLTMAGAVRQDTLSSLVGADGDRANFKVNSLGRLWVSAAVDSALPAGNNNIGDVDVASLPAMPAGTNLIGKVVPATTCGTTAVSQALAAVPTSSTAVFTSTTCVQTIFLNNTNATSQTVTVTDNAGTPVNGVGPAFVIPGLSNLVIPLYGVPFTSGLKWSAGGTGVTGGIFGYQ